MVKFVLLCGVCLPLTSRAVTPGSCDDGLARVNLEAEDPYERLGLDPDVALTETTARFRRAVRDVSSRVEVNRLAEAYAQIRLNDVSGRRLDKSALPVGALRRAHGKIYGDPMSGRFTVGYGLNGFLQPTADAELLIRDVLRDEKAVARLRALPGALRGPFQQYVEYFAKQIRRLGVEGGFEDVVSTNWYRNAEDRRGRRNYYEAMRAFVELFGVTYQNAVTDPKGPGITALKDALRMIHLPPPPPRRPLMEQLAHERDPRTFLRKIVYHLRKPKRKDPADFLLRAGEAYQKSFLVEPGQFLQHILYFATADWTGFDLGVTTAADRRLVEEVFQNLHYLWIVAPTMAESEPRWFEYASVLYDAYHFLSPRPVQAIETPQPESPLWRQLDDVARAQPALLERVKLERQPPELPSDILPW